MNRGKYAEALAAITTESGELTPGAVVVEAQDPDSDLHDFFEWDDTKAGHKYRLVQARQLIRSVTVVIETDEIILRVPEYLRNPEKESSEQGYMRTATMKTDDDIKRGAMVAEFSRAGAAMKRARDIAKYFDMQSEVDRVIGDIETIHSEAAAP